MRTKESALESSLRVKIEALGHGVRCLKFVSPGCTGVPDRIVLIPGGETVFVEMKQAGQKEGARQVYVQDRLRDLGFTVFSTVDRPERIDEVVKHIRERMFLCGYGDF